MNFKDKKAIKSLESHLKEIESVVNTHQGNNWKASLKDIINLYIGEDSSISKRLDKLYFTRNDQYTDPEIGVFDKYIFDESKKQNFKDLVRTAIRHIELNGVNKSSNSKNYFYNFNNTEIISGISGLIILIFGIGFYFGKIERDKDTIRLEDKSTKIEKENITLKIQNDSLYNVIKNIKSTSQLKKSQNNNSFEK